MPILRQPPRHMNLDSALAKSFLDLLDRGAGGFTFQTFEDKKPVTKPELAKVVHSPAQPELLRLHALGAGVYITVNATDGKGRKNENVTRIRAIYRKLGASVRRTAVSVAQERGLLR